ncbi:MAG: hypothetical protein IJ783_06080 [Kiritimatiellae bacterium]|nr:hypothetical protein [Kiritimatiellia bacterium]
MTRLETRLLLRAERAEEPFDVSGAEARAVAELHDAELLDATVVSDENGKPVEAMVFGIALAGRDALDRRHDWIRKAVWVSFNALVSALVSALVALAVSRLAGR